MSVFIGVMCDHRGEACDKQFFPIETRTVDDGDADDCYQFINEIVGEAHEAGWRFRGSRACCPKCYLLDKPE